MSRQTHIFATRSDLLTGLRLVESMRNMKYALCGMFDTQKTDVFTLSDLQNTIGHTKSKDHVGGNCYLVIDAEKDLKTEKVHQRRGGIKYSISQLLNPVSICFQPGGMYDNRCLICGHIGTASDDAVSIELYRIFARAITKEFKKIGVYHVGREALALMESGLRLITMGVDEPMEYDLNNLRHGAKG